MPLLTPPFPEPDRVLVAGDWHGDTSQAARRLALAAAEGIRVVIQLGDFGVWAGPNGEDYRQTLDDLADDLGLELLFIDGNHENFDLLHSFEIDATTGLRPLGRRLSHLPRGSRFTWHGVRFAALGGATSLDRRLRTEGVSWWPQEEITPAQAEAVVAEGQTDVLLTHDCPEGVDIPGINRLDSLRHWPEAELRVAWAHREQLAYVAEQVAPTHLLHGHFHIPYVREAQLSPGITTLVAGLGAEFQGPGSIAVLDLKQLGEDVTARRHKRSVLANYTTKELPR